VRLWQASAIYRIRLLALPPPGPTRPRVAAGPGSAAVPRSSTRLDWPAGGPWVAGQVHPESIRRRHGHIMPEPARDMHERAVRRLGQPGQNSSLGRPRRADRLCRIAAVLRTLILGRHPLAGLTHGAEKVFAQAVIRGTACRT